MGQPSSWVEGGCEGRGEDGGGLCGGRGRRGGSVMSRGEEGGRGDGEAVGRKGGRGG